MNFLNNNQRATNTFLKANIFSKFSFSYLNGLFKIGNKRTLEATDILKNREEHNTKPLKDELLRKWNLRKEKKNKHPSFFWTLLSFCSLRWFVVVVMFVLLETMKIIQPLFLKLLLDIIAKDDIGNDAYKWAGALAITILTQWIFHHHAFYLGELLGINNRSAALGLIYDKIFRLRQSKLGEVSIGHVITLFSSDSQKIQDGLILSAFILIAPLELIYAIYTLWTDIGPSSLAGLSVVIFLLPLQSWLGKIYGKIRVKTVKKTDERVSIMNEIISSMQVTKMYGWEDSFSTLVNKKRKEEIRQIMKAAMIRAFNLSMYENGYYINMLATFVTFYFQGDGQITLGKIYVVMSIFFVIRLSVTQDFPLAIQLMTELYVSCKRIENFLLQEEIVDDSKHQVVEKDTTNPYVLFDNVTASWGGVSLIPVVRDVSFKADHQNSLIIINGPTGSGKTSILMAALKEIAITKGHIEVNGTVSYAPQQAWIFCGTVRQNILFGKEFNEKWYEVVIEACALRKDIELFDRGDLTLVGEKGVSLSGGQKARIGLARAVYADSDIYFLDDPLSAVDAKVRKDIFNRCIQKTLKDKIVILVTHQLQYADQATQVINLKELEATYSMTNLSESGLDSGCPSEENCPIDDIADVKDIENTDYIISSVDEDEKLSEEDEENFMNGMKAEKNDGNENDFEESRARGSIGWKLYVQYFVKGVGWIQTILLVIVMTIGQAYLTFVDYWFGEWGQGENLRWRNETIKSNFLFKENPDYNIYLFVALVVFGLIINTFRSMFLFRTLVNCSRSLHNFMFSALLKAPMYFFDTNPIGQVLNRFSGDIFLMDDNLPWIFFDLFRLGLLTLAVVIVNCINVPYIVIVILVLAVAFGYLRRYYMKVAREVRRLECIARSPLYTHISATLNGITSIRVLNKDNIVKDEFLRCLDYQTEASITFRACSRWFTQRIDFMACVFITCSLFAPLVAAPYIDEEDRGLIAVGLTYLLTLCGSFQWCVRQSTEVDNMMTSVERVIEYTQLEPEPDNGKREDLPKNWPSNGNISTKSVSFKYHESLPNVLKDISFDIKPQEKIGIIGRTGAGKSTLVALLFRLGKYDGVLNIDGVDISQLKLKCLRKSISVIPQDPVLFSGTLRKNLDPFDDFSDEDIWDAIEEVQLKRKVEEMKSKLNAEINESGSNLSVGEKQLICLARALLKKSKILMIDEATANVDHETDMLIQNTIRNKFKECTVLTIAHRLNTVMDSDRILVMDDGRIGEFDDPYTLLQNENGLLKKLIQQHPTSEAKTLVEQAEAKYLLKNENTYL